MIDVKIDTKELTDFADRLHSEYEFKTTIMTATQNIARVLHQLILQYTPIQTGNLRKMWSAGDNLLFTVEPIGNGFQVTLINSAKNPKGEKYAVWVNDGHRKVGGGWVYGKFFVEKAIVETQSNNLEKIIMKELDKWIGWCCNG